MLDGTVAWEKMPSSDAAHGLAMAEKGEQRLLTQSKFWLARVKWPAPGAPLAWMLAASLIMIGVILKLLLEGVGREPLPPYVTFYPAVVLAALGGGPVIGVTSAVITLVLAWLFQSRSLSVPAAVIYAFTSILLGWVVGSARLSFEEAKTARTHGEYTARESVHRIKNLIAVVQAIIRKVFREVETVEQYRDILTDRMNGLAIAQSILLEQDWQDAPLHALIDSALAPFLPNPGLTLRRGPHATIPAGCVRGLSMALYELCTNAMKYGALAEGRGPVLLTWKVESEHVVLEWEEKTATDPRHGVGFGATLIRVALAGEPGSRVEYRVEPEGVFASFQWRQRHALPQTDYPATGDRRLP